VAKLAIHKHSKEKHVSMHSLSPSNMYLTADQVVSLMPPNIRLNMKSSIKTQDEKPTNSF